MARLSGRIRVGALRCDANSKSSKRVRPSAFCTIAFLEINSWASLPAFPVKFYCLKLQFYFYVIIGTFQLNRVERLPRWRESGLLPIVAGCC